MSRAPSVRLPAVAGSFYPARPNSLRAALRDSFARARPVDDAAPPPKALVVPHAGYIFSGPIAATAYARLEPLRTTVRRVVLAGPSHRVPFLGLAATAADVWRTPLGDVPIDHSADELIRRAGPVVIDDRPHALEHSLEVQIPFLQTVLDDFALIPLVVGQASASEVAALLDALWGDDETIVVISTDLSHYHQYDDAAVRDAQTAAAIVTGRPDHITGEDACGSRPLRGLLAVAEQKDLSVELLDLRNSGDTAGDRERVVGYGSFALA